ncbi:efflux RND transporter periplasmic adaptor subunit [Craterilacuibacter sp.]|uniref:efflux RND transporter periplasmic adaptor subunit n=1 Tax=Craterilacuibacter sp. TaxID=2870909 RepID=UPI003F317F93
MITTTNTPSRLLCTLLLLCPLAGTAATPAKAAPAKPPAPIRVLLAPALETTLASQLVGRITAVNVSLGQSFAKGTPLVRFDCSEQNARLKMSEAELAATRENYEAKLRLQGLQQASEVEVSLAASNVAKARAQIGLSRAQLTPCTVHAPFAGRAVKVAVKPHQGVNQGQILLELVSHGSLKLRLNAPAKWVGWLKRGTPFEVQIDETGKPYRARVVAINGRIDAVSQTIELEGVIDQASPELLPGMSGSARFTPPA